MSQKVIRIMNKRGICLYKII